MSRRKQQRRRQSTVARRVVAPPRQRGLADWLRDNLLVVAAGLAAVVLVVVVVLALVLRGGGETALTGLEGARVAALDGSPSLPGEYIAPRPEDVPLAEHLDPGTIYDGYSSDPPTSGPHDPSPVEPGVYDEPVPRERLLHNMEHSGVVVWYNCAAGETLEEAACAELVAALTEIVEDYDDTLPKGGVTLTPYPNMTDAHVAVTGWTRLLKLDQVDEAAIRAFIDTHLGRYDPEGFY